MAKQFAQNGFDLLIAADGDGIHQTASGFQVLGANLQPFQIDLAEHEGTHKLIDAIRAAGRPVNAVAINAGFGVSGRFVETNLADEMNRQPGSSASVKSAVSKWR